MYELNFLLVLKSIIDFVTPSARFDSTFLISVKLLFLSTKVTNAPLWFLPIIVSTLKLPNLEESLSDPLSNKKIYSSNKCESTNKTSKYVLVTKVFNIMEIEISCNSTSSLGQISFGNDGKVYSKLSPFENENDEYEITNQCIIKLINDKSESKELVIEPKTGYVYKI